MIILLNSPLIVYERKRNRLTGRGFLPCPCRALSHNRYGAGHSGPDHGVVAHSDEPHHIDMGRHR